MMVVLTHCSGGWQAALAPWQDTLAMPLTFTVPLWLGTIAGQGSHGVQLFFVISAFLLTIQAGRRHDDWLAYTVRRIARVGPGYWLAGLAYAVPTGLAPRLWAPSGVMPTDLGIAAAFGSAWQGGASLAVVPGGWSVCCEVAFYAVLPALLWLIGGRLWRAVLLAGAAAIGVLLLTQWELTHGGWHFVPHFINPLVQAPVFLAGIAAAVSTQRLRPSRLPDATLALLALAVFGIPLLGIVVPMRQMLSHLPFAVLAASAVALAAQDPPRVLASALMRRLGKVSYSLYLVHFAQLAPCLAAAEWLKPSDGWATLALHFGLTASVSFGAACLGYRWVEQPCIRWAAGMLRARRPAAMMAE